VIGRVGADLFASETNWCVCVCVCVVQDALYAFELALMLEKFVYRKLLDLHALGADCEDPQFCDEIEKYLGEQVRAIKEMASYVAQIKRLGTGHGVWDLDKELGEKAGAAA
jgi:ferritin